MKKIRRLSSCFLALLMLLGCASQPPASTTDLKAGSCEFTDDQVIQIRSRALEFLIAEWPVLDVECEQLGTSARQTENGECALAGGPAETGNCPEPSHSGYVITFDEESLDPVAIYWLSAVD